QQFGENFVNWTSGNKEIDSFIQFSQISSNSPESLQKYIRSSSHPVMLMVHSQSTSVEEVIQQHQKFLHCLNNHFAPGIDWYGISQDPEKMHSYPSVNLLCLFNSGFTYSTLRTDSFVVKNDQTVALRDFLCAIDSKKSHVFKYYFVPYMGPEFLKEGKITKECNIYTFGLIMYRFSTPFMQELKDLNLAPESTPKSYITLMRQCLNNNPKLHEFRQMSRVEFGNKLNESDTISPNDKDISTGSLLSIVSNLGVDLIDIDQFANRQYIGGEPRLLRQLDYPYDKRSDIYSFGVLMWEISSGQCPFIGLDELTTRLNIIDGNRETPVPGAPDIYRELYVESWDDGPQKRPTIDIVLERLISMNSQYFISSSVSDEPSQTSEGISNFEDVSKSE
ncbi:2752_t:CDS:2, partial [Gigaspora margarita]